MEKCIICNNIISEDIDEEFIIPGEGHVCCQECKDRFFAKKKQQEEIESIRKIIKEEVLPPMKMAVEVMQCDELNELIDTADQILNLVDPLVEKILDKFFCSIARSASKMTPTLALNKAQAMAAGVKCLEEAGFTKEDAIKMMVAPLQ